MSKKDHDSALTEAFLSDPASWFNVAEYLIALTGPINHCEERRDNHSVRFSRLDIVSSASAPTGNRSVTVFSFLKNGKAGSAPGVKAPGFWLSVCGLRESAPSQGAVMIPIGIIRSVQMCGASVTPPPASGEARDPPLARSCRP